MRTPNRTHLDSQFIGSVPETYDVHLGPFLFKFLAADLARRAAPMRTTLSEIVFEATKPTRRG